jgi:hypothetical protein
VRPLFTVIAVVTIILAACTASSGTPSPSAAAPASASPTASDASPEPTVADPTDSPAPPLGRGSSASVAVDSLALSEAPATDSTPAGSLARDKVVFIAEVVQADGATWFQLLPSDPGSGPESGWAAIGGDGSAQLTRIELGCDSIGVDAATVAAMSPFTALACYSKPFDFEAWIVDCNCDIDGPFVDPDWLGAMVIKNPATGQPTTALLVNPGSPVPGDSADWLMVHLDPAGDYPDPLPFEQNVLITGSFDHPAAASCKAPAGVEIVPKDPVLYCRTTFAITEIKLGG